MTLIDSSAWIEYLRGTGSTTQAAVASLIKTGEAQICPPVRLELLSGQGDDLRVQRLKRLLALAAKLSVTEGDFDRAATHYRRCRQAGETVRSQIDCLIAAIAIAHDLPVLHNDKDFDVLARHTPLQVTRG